MNAEGPSPSLSPPPMGKGMRRGQPNPEDTGPRHILFSGQIWKTEDVKMSVPGQAVAEEPSTQHPSPRGTSLSAVLALCCPPVHSTPNLSARAAALPVSPEFRKATRALDSAARITVGRC